ncbi:MAG: beta-hydroxyacyl-ACP dehydratase [Flavobacteriales bacterium]|nr:MAG: beta-hydroxyacyl-ACP dehydratase [Flavobacteriales bacterium]
MNKESIIALLPYQKPFLFVDELLEVSSEGAVGSFTFSRELDFYKGHFKDYPVTPGVILTECCAQIGLVCLGIFLSANEKERPNGVQIGLSNAQMDFLLPVYPDEKVVVRSEKEYFRFNKLKCHVKMHNEQGQLVCKGTISGMLKSTAYG